MSGATLLEDLDRLVVELRSLVEVVEGSDGADAVRRAWRRAEGAFERWRSRAPEVASASADERVGVARRLAEAVELNALATALAARESDRAKGRLEALAAARRRLRALEPAQRTGGSCDLSG